MSDTGEVIHLSDLVADLKQRVEALERQLAMTAEDGLGNVIKALEALDGKIELLKRRLDGPSTDIGALWDNASNGEKRWSEEDFA